MIIIIIIIITIIIIIIIIIIMIIIGWYSSMEVSLCQLIYRFSQG